MDYQYYRLVMFLFKTRLEEHRVYLLREGGKPIKLKLPLVMSTLFYNTGNNSRHGMYTL
jgi:hypothetical protein